MRYQCLFITWLIKDFSGILNLDVQTNPDPTLLQSKYIPASNIEPEPKFLHMWIRIRPKPPVTAGSATLLLIETN